MIDVVIDVSDAQGRIDWPQVAKAGIVLAFVKASEGLTFKAKTFDYNAKAAADAGISVCAYDFLRPGYGEQQAQFFVETAKLEKNSLAMLDWEGRAADTCSAAEAEAAGRKLIEITGREPVGYWGMDGSTPAPPTPTMASWVRFIPRYPHYGAQCYADLSTTVRSNPGRWWPEAMFAQYTCWGVVPGIERVVDRSFWFGTKDELTKWLADGTRPSWAKQSPAHFGKLWLGATGTAVRQLQQRLTTLGFDPGGIDGRYGANTQKAVDAFATAAGLPPSHNGVNATLWLALFSNQTVSTT